MERKMDRKFITKEIEQLKKIDIFSPGTFYGENLENIIESNQKKPFKIAVVGEFSTGKSTFINALLGVDLLSHATEEVTATITNIFNVAKSDKRYRTCDVTFMDGTKKHLDDDKMLIEYTTTKSKLMNDVAYKIKCVDYYADFMGNNEDIVLVDTPGLNGMADGHRELTLQEVKTADFCIYLFGIRGITASDKVILELLKEYQTNFIFVLNFIDQLKVSEGEKTEERVKDIERYLKEEIFPDNSVKYEVFGVSALKALVSKDFSIKFLYQEDKKEIKDEERAKLYKQSGYKKLETYIFKQINSSTIENLCVERMQYMLRNLLEHVIVELEEEQKYSDELRKDADNSNRVVRLREKLDSFNEASERNKEKVLNYVRSECINIKKEFLNYVKEQLEIKKKEKIAGIELFNGLEELESYIYSGQLDNQVKADADRIYGYVENNMASCFNGILSNILLRVQEYFKDIRMDKEQYLIEFDVKKIVPSKLHDIENMESEIRMGEKNAISAEYRLNRAREDYKVAEEQQTKGKESLNANNQKLRSVESRKEREINDLGRQPEVERWTEYTKEYYTEKKSRRGFFGKIADCLFGEKTVEKCREVPHERVDDSKRREWDKKREAVLQRFNPEIDRYKRQIDKDQSQITNAERAMEKSNNDIITAKEDLEYYQGKLERDKKVLDNIRKNAQQEMLTYLKKQIREQLEQRFDYEDGCIANVVKEYIQEVVEQNGKKVQEFAQKFYDENTNRTREMYNREINGRKTELLGAIDDYTNQIKEIKNIKKEIEKYA